MCPLSEGNDHAWIGALEDEQRGLALFVRQLHRRAVLVGSAVAPMATWSHDGTVNEPSRTYKTTSS